MLIAIYNLLYFFLQKSTHYSSEPKRQIRPDGGPGRTGGDSRTVRECTIDIKLQRPTITSLEGSLSQKTDALTLQVKILPQNA